MLLHIQHETTYRYERLVKQSVQSLRLTPRTEAGQRVLSWALQAPGRRSQQLDAHGNVMHLLTLDEPHDEIVITVTGTVETEEVRPRPPVTLGVSAGDAPHDRGCCVARVRTPSRVVDP